MSAKRDSYGILHKLCGCHEGDTYCNGKHWDHRKLSDHLHYRLHDWLKQTPKNLRWAIAGRLRWLACKVMGQKWYVADAWHGVPGNRAHELQTQIWQDVVLTSWVPHDHPDHEEREAKLAAIDSKLCELSQLAGDCWGHIQPKDQQFPR